MTTIVLWLCHFYLGIAVFACLVGMGMGMSAAALKGFRRQWKAAAQYFLAGLGFATTAGLLVGLSVMLGNHTEHRMEVVMVGTVAVAFLAFGCHWIFHRWRNT